MKIIGVAILAATSLCAVACSSGGASSGVSSAASSADSAFANALASSLPPGAVSNNAGQTVASNTTNQQSQIIRALMGNSPQNIAAQPQQQGAFHTRPVFHTNPVFNRQTQPATATSPTLNLLNNLRIPNFFPNNTPGVAAPTTSTPNNNLALPWNGGFKAY